ncbi:cytochrome c oxidase assembly protein [Cereibacter changlensis]|uniref:Putative membrane protein n=1 Tax=Cereibacter changlensis TaxID=402884 RepID=A0A2W7RP80_9RHOB|nr:cytochrome c oxidase assembly protein [Cereibacter changlensis]PZX56289.1 putative membrane protein [Cereibacter changlensis]
MRAAALTVAVLALALAWVAPLERWLGAFPAHMLGHMTLVAVAAPALVLAFPQGFARLGVPVLAGAVLEFLIVWGWHLPALHGAARLALPWHLAEQALFLAGGLAVWAGALRAAEPLAGAGALLLTSMHMTLLGALLVLAGKDLYAEICGTPPSLPGQQLGGLLMLGIGTPIYLFGGLWLTASALRRPDSAEAGA